MAIFDTAKAAVNPSTPIYNIDPPSKPTTDPNVIACFLEILPVGMGLPLVLVIFASSFSSRYWLMELALAMHKPVPMDDTANLIASKSPGATA